jgi:hypothetical protein
MKQNWYIATLVIECRVANEFSDFEEQIRAIRAPNAEIAYEKALRFGQEAETSYQNGENQTVTWAFLGLNDLEELPFESAIRDGTEIRNRFLSDPSNPTVRVSSRERLSVFLGNQASGTDVKLPH